MKKISTLFYGFGQGLLNIKRNRMFSIASIGTMTACLFLFGIFYFVLSNFQFMVKSAETTVGISVFFDEGATQAEIDAIETQIRTRAEVAEVDFKSADEAWEEYKTNKLDEELAKTFGDDNPLAESASFTVYLNDISMQNSLVKFIKNLDGVRRIIDTEEVADTLSGLNQVIAYVSGAIIIILLGVAAFLISTTVTMGISVRKEEISIMKLIGATDFFIRIPYIVEGIIIGLLGACIPLIFLYAIYYKIIAFITDKFDSVLSRLEFLDINIVFSTLIPISILIGVGIGFLGSYVTLKKQLRKI